MHKKRKRVISIYVIIILLGIFVGSKTTDLSLLDDTNSLTLTADEFTPSLERQLFKLSDHPENRYKILFSEDDLSNLSGSNYTLMLYKLADNAHRVFLNGQLIGSAGDTIKGNSNLWNGLFYYTIDQNTLKAENVLEIVTYSIYQSGSHNYPVYIVDSTVANKLISRLEFYGVKLVLFAIGFVAFSSAITLILFYISRNRNQMYLYLSFGTIFSAIYYYDYIITLYMPLEYLTYKKIIMTAMVLSFAFVSLAIHKYFDNKYPLWVGILTGALFMPFMIMSSNMILFKSFYSLYYYVLLINIVLWVVISIKNINKRPSAYIFLMGFVVIGFYGLLSAVLDTIGGFFTLNSPVLYIIVFASIPLMLANEEFLEKDIQLDQERDLKEAQTKRALTDPLTNLWNQRYINTVMRSSIQHYTMIIIDIDYFKVINDTYGHLAGDFILKEISYILAQNIRKTDELCRYGGDEFILFMHNCDGEKAYIHMETIRSQIEHEVFRFQGQDISVTISVGIFATTENKEFDEIFSSADKSLYRAKTMGRNYVHLQN